MIQPVLTYCSDMWVKDNNTLQKLLSTEMMYWIRHFGLTLLDHVKNKTIREKMEVKNTIMDDTAEEQLKRYGLLQRMNKKKIPIKVWK